MPTLLSSATFLESGPTSNEYVEALHRVGYLLGANNLVHGGELVLINVARALEAVQQVHPLVENFGDGLHAKATQAVKYLDFDRLQSAKTMARLIPEKTEATTFFLCLPQEADDRLIRAAGNLLCIAELTDSQAGQSRFKRLNTLANAFRKEPRLSTQQELDLERILTNSEKDLGEALSLRINITDKKRLSFSVHLNHHLRSSLYSAHPVEQQATNPRLVISGQKLKSLIEGLRVQAEQGSRHATGFLTAFCIGLPIDLVARMPIHDHSDGPDVGWIDANTGIVHIKTDSLLRDLGRAVPDAIETRGEIQLQLPVFVAKTLRLARALDPSLHVVGDLLPDRDTSSSEILEDLQAESQRAKLLRSAADAALDICHQRQVVAFAFLAFHLLTPSDVHYITLSTEQIWKLRSEVFEQVGLGVSPPWGSNDTHHIGSRRTPETDSLRRIMVARIEKLNHLRPGKKYRLDQVVEFHNAYVSTAALYLQIATAARNREKIEFHACSWFPGSPFGWLRDKGESTTPVPISSHSNKQLELLLDHNKSIASRLEKLLGASAKPVVDWVRSIAERKPVNVLFTLTEDGTPSDLTIRTVFDLDLEWANRDLGRHYLATQLTDQGESLENIQCLLRHHGESIAPQSAFGFTTPLDRLAQIALSCDLAMQKLGIKPVAGLVGGGSR